jgi:two-component system, LytTR family, sensor kinase
MSSHSGPRCKLFYGLETVYLFYHMQNRALLKYKIHHLFFWLLVSGIWYFLRYQDYESSAQAALVTFIKVADLAILVYLTNYVLLPRLFYKKKYTWFVVAFLVMIVISSSLKMMLIGTVIHDVQMMTLSGNLKTRIYDNVIPHFFLVMAGAVVKLMFDYTKLQRQIAEIAKEKAEAELNFLKSQINPHFLFNSLNSVYFLIDKNNADARESLHKFSDMLRYQLYELKGNRIPVEKEVGYLKDYVDLQKLRRDDHYKVRFESTHRVQGFSIEPLLLVPFVENAFKHISHHPKRDNFVNLSLDRVNGHFIFKAENSKDGSKANEKPGGIGLANVKRRLELLYPDRHTLEIHDGKDSYAVELKLKIEE